MLEALKSIYFSKTMRAPNRTKSICYDLGPDDDDQNRIPCSIRSIVDRKCKTCHEDDSNSLNIAAEAQKDGKPWFVHDGYSVAESATEILYRITESDSDMRMPLGEAELSDEELKVFTDWLILNGARQSGESAE